MSERAHRFSTRAFMTLLAATSFAGLPIAGTCLHFVSKAAREDAALWGLSQHAWMSVHNILGLLFVVAIAGHLIYNWRPLLRYLRANVTRSPAFTTEFVAAASVVVVVVTAVAAHPFLLD